MITYPGHEKNTASQQKFESSNPLKLPYTVKKFYDSAIRPRGSINQRLSAVNIAIHSFRFLDLFKYLEFLSFGTLNSQFVYTFFKNIHTLIYKESAQSQPLKNCVGFKTL